jgi:hypothetical protein
MNVEFRFAAFAVPRITDIRIAVRQVYGWQGGHGWAETVTGRLPSGRRATLKRTWLSPEGSRRYSHGDLHVYVTRKEFKALIVKGLGPKGLGSKDMFRHYGIKGRRAG